MMLTKTNNIDSSNTSYNWPVVGTLLFFTGIAGIPAMFFVAMVALAVLGIGGEASFISSIHFSKPGAMFVHGGGGYFIFLNYAFSIFT